MSYKLLIVESPKKAKTIASILGNSWRIGASFGHIRDLPEKDYEQVEVVKGAVGRGASS